MIAEALLDSNILLYAVSNAPAEKLQRARARELMAASGAGYSTQVFSEFYDNATRKLKPRLTHEQAVAILEPLRIFPVQPVTLEVIWDGFKLKQRYQISFWDATIIAAARALGCRLIWSEDLNDGQIYDGIQVRNPFK